MKKFLKKILSVWVAVMFTIMGMSGAGCAGGDSPAPTPVPETDVEKTEYEFNSFINNLSAFPVKFVYDGATYTGFDSKYFRVEDKNLSESADKDTVTAEITVRRTASFKARINATLYRSYNAFDYTVYFENDSNEDSAMLSEVMSFDYYVNGANPELKGILGDHTNSYLPYDYNLSAKKYRNVKFVNTIGRATHVYFPYFNLETDDGGYMLALGWGGTWRADFKQETDKGTHIIFQNCVGSIEDGIDTYLKPGESFRTALIGVVRYYTRNEDVATNAWRKWMVDKNMPRDNANTDEPVKPSMSSCLASDSGKPNSDGSISESYDTWKRSLDAMYDHGVNMEFRWFDAGWYFDAYGNTVSKDWYGTVGTWQLDTVKWPNGSFRESVDYAHAHGTKTLVWFGPERATGLEGLRARHGYDRSWPLSANNKYLNDLGKPDCLNWTLNKIISFMSENDIDLYREDFNLEPADFWAAGDIMQGFDRYGMTENQYMQGHYALWDGIIKWCGEHGKCTYIDGCASGGGRNDLESLRRAVPLLRSDSDRTTIGIKLSYTTSLCKWIPYTGACATDSTNELAAANVDLYAIRACFIAHMNISAKWYHSQDTLPWAEILQGRNEWLEANKYFLKDFYTLTPYNAKDDETNWTAYMYWDKDTDSGLLQAFRQKDCQANSVFLEVKGVSPDKYYRVRDIDGKQSVERVLGATLQSGLTLTANKARTALVLYIEPVA